MPVCQNDVSDHVIGTRGMAQMRDSAQPRVHEVSPAGSTKWAYEGEPKSMYDVEHDELFAGIRAGRPINDGEAAAHSTLMAILGREAAYSGKKVTWQEMFASTHDLSPKQYAWGPNPVMPVPVPGSYKFS